MVRETTGASLCGLLRVGSRGGDAAGLNSREMPEVYARA